MSEKFRPREHQVIMMDHIVSNPRCAVWCFMGGGKTSATLTALDSLSLVEDVYPALVIAPKRVARSTWPDEVKQWDHLNHLNVRYAGGPALSRRIAMSSKADIITANPEMLPWLIEHCGDAWPFKTIVFDEASRLAGFRLRQGTKRTRELARVAFKTKRFIELTGTPASNGIVKLWGQLWFLDQGSRLGKTFTAFASRWFRQSFDGFSLAPMPNAQAEIMERISDLCLSIRAEDFFSLEAPVIAVRKLALRRELQERYNELEKSMFLEMEGHEIEPLNAAARTNKCLQFASGAIYVEGAAKTWVDVHDEKFDALDSIISEAAGAPVLVAYNFRHELARLKKKYPHGVELDSDPRTIASWNAGRIPLLFAHPASAGHGLNLQHGGNILVYLGINWNLEEHEQILERIGPARQKQSGYNRSVFVYYLIVEDTLEEDVLERLRSKKSVQDILLEAMARRGYAVHSDK